MDHSDRQELQMKLLTMTDSELLARETLLSQKQPCPTAEAIEYGMVMSELQHRTRSESGPMGRSQDPDEIEAALAAAVAHFLRRVGKDEIVLSDRELTGGWLEVTRSHEFWAFRLKDNEA